MSAERREQKRELVQSVINEYLALENKLENPPAIHLRLIPNTPDGKLVGASSVAISTAIQCYSPGIAKLTDRITEKEVGIGNSTLEAGHHTTRMHTNYMWKFIGVTRSVTHDIFHATPFYNSEQQSQRYVEARDGNYLLPDNLDRKQKEFYKSACDFSNKSYFQLLELLKPAVEMRVKEMNPAGGWKVDSTKERLLEKSRKLSQEIARYVLPLAQHTNYDHSLNELQLLRLFRASKMENFTDEARFIIGSMISAVSKADPSILDELDVPLSNSGSANILDKNLFDEKLDGKQSVLISKSEALQFGQNYDFDLKVLADVYETGMFDPKTSTLRQIWLTFATKMSHAGDSQRQRHRRTASNVSSINDIYDGTMDYTTPLVIKENPELKAVYDFVIAKMYENVNSALEMGIPKEYSLLLIPNAINVRVIESGDLFDWVHRWKQRLCYLAQEEIFFASLDQVESLEKVMPEVRSLLAAPCRIRQLAGVSPRCPEGSKWCGQPVFNWKLKEYRNHRLI